MRRGLIMKISTLYAIDFVKNLSVETIALCGSLDLVKEYIENNLGINFDCFKNDDERYVFYAEFDTDIKITVRKTDLVEE